MLLQSLLLLFLLAASTHAALNAIPDCTEDGKFLETAMNCENAVAASFCDQVYPVATYGLPVKGDVAQDKRIPQCYAVVPTGAITTLTTDPAFIQAATMTCAKQCGFCCKTPKFNCKNADEPAITCEKVTQDMCKDSKWRDTIAVNCPNKCGFCLDGGCVDAAVDCDKDPLICKKTAMATFAKANCKRTCGFCATNSTTGSPTGGACGDTHPNCGNWVHNGFCQSNGYTDDQKRQYCGRSCGFC